MLALRQRSQAPRDRSWRGSLVNLGSFRDVLHFHASDDMVRLEASFFEGTGRAEDRYSLPDDVAEACFKGDIFYLSADRLGPRVSLPYLEEGHGSATPLGSRGEHVLSYLDNFGHFSVLDCVRWCRKFGQ